MVLASRIDDGRFVYIPQEGPNPHQLFLQREDRTPQIIVADDVIQSTMKLVAQFTATFIVTRSQGCICLRQDLLQHEQLRG